MAEQKATQPPDDLNLINAGYVADLYELYRADPSSVDPEWRARFDAGFAGLEPVTAAQPASNGEGPAPAVARPAASTAAAPPSGGQPISGPAARLARNMTASLAVPTATSFRDIDVSVLEARRRELNQQIALRKVSFTHLIGYAMVRAANAQRSMTHAYAETDGQPFRLDPGAVNLGLAVDVERGEGSRFLVVPVIKGAEAMGFAAFHDRYEELVEKARTNHLSPDDMVGGTITLTNPGTLGTTASVPRLMAGQGTIVATGAIRSVGEQRLMTVTSTYDHRIIQGAESGTFLGLAPEVLSRIPASPLGVHVPGDNLEMVLEQLRQTYTGTIAYEVEHIGNHEERAWLRRVIESGEHRQPLSTDERRALLERLTAVEGLERFLHKAYLGQKRFSIEGLDTMVPMLEVILRMAGEQGTRHAVIGMAHRGRLNVLAHIVGVSYESILSEFEASRLDEELMPEDRQADDVKYHLGASGRFETPTGSVDVSVMPNPSHLEAVD